MKTVFVVIAVMWFATGCFEELEKPIEPDRSVESQGIVLLGGCLGQPASLVNTNSEVMRVKLVRQGSGTGFGESTISIDFLDPGEKKLFSELTSNHRFYIYKGESAAELGLLRRSC